MILLAVVACVATAGVPALGDEPAGPAADDAAPREERVAQNPPAPAPSPRPPAPRPGQASGAAGTANPPRTTTPPQPRTTTPPQPRTTTPPGARPGVTGTAPALAAAAAPTAGTTALAQPGALESLTGLSSAAANLPYNMLGDLPPGAVVPVPPTPPGIPPPGTPPTPPTPGRPPVGPGGTPRPGIGAPQRSAVILPWVRGFKIADNQSPQPQDRVFATFNYFDNLEGRINKRFNSGIQDIQIYRETFGFEKTFLDKNASIGLRMPLNSITATNAIAGLPGASHTAIGDLTVFGKYVLISDPKTGSLISSGLAVTAPTGPSTFGGTRSFNGFHYTTFQPFIGYLWNQEKWFAQGFIAIDTPTSTRDVTILYNDLGVGYYLYRAKSPNQFLTAVVPTFETHVSTPLNHAGFNLFDPASTPNVVDLTLGTTFQFGKRTRLSLGVCDPVTGPKPFTIEAIALLNVYY
jgi:hypothetical protein